MGGDALQKGSAEELCVGATPLVSYQLIRIKVLAKAAHPCPTPAKRNARHSHQGSRASVLMWHCGEMDRDFRSLLAFRRHAQSPRHNARPLASLFLLVSVTPASQFLLTTRGGILVRCTSPVVTEKSSPTAAGFSYFYPPGRLSQASPSPSPSKL